jgi:hypothetical protein
MLLLLSNNTSHGPVSVLSHATQLEQTGSRNFSPLHRGILYELCSVFADLQRKQPCYTVRLFTDDRIKQEIRTYHPFVSEAVQTDVNSYLLTVSLCTLNSSVTTLPN